MEERQMQLEYSSSLSHIVEVNPSFDSAKLRIAYTGKNRNNSFISKESFERAIPTMFNCPVVANYMREEDEIGSHDGELVENSDGEVKYVYITQPVGIVPESAQWNWETIDDGGVIHEYLCTDVILWKRQEAYDKIRENGITKQSMEISVINGGMHDGYYKIDDFCFTAFCLLGTAEPCFESAALLFSMEEQSVFKQQYTEMLKEFKLACANNNDEKEVSENLKLKELLEKYQVTESDLDFEYENLSDEELEERFINAYESAEVDDNSADEEDSDLESDDLETAQTSDDFALNSDLFNQLYDYVRGLELLSTDWGEYPRYYMVDFDTEVNEVYFRDLQESALYGCTYSLDGDDVVLDIENKKKKKYAIVDYIEGTRQEFTIDEIMSRFNEAYSALTDQYNKATTEVERLKAFEAKVVKDRRDADEAALFAKYDNHEILKGNEDYESLKSNCSDMTIDAIEKEIFALIGKISMANYSLKTKEESTQAPKPMFGLENLNNDKDGAKDEWEASGLFECIEKK